MNNKIEAGSNFSDETIRTTDTSEIEMERKRKLYDLAVKCGLTPYALSTLRLQDPSEAHAVIDGVPLKLTETLDSHIVDVVDETDPKANIGFGQSKFSFEYVGSGMSGINLILQKVRDINNWATDETLALLKKKEAALRDNSRDEWGRFERVAKKLSSTAKQAFKPTTLP